MTIFVNRMLTQLNPVGVIVGGHRDFLVNETNCSLRYRIAQNLRCAEHIYDFWGLPWDF